MNPQQRKNLAADISVILGHTVVGSVKYPNLLLAPRRMEEWISGTLPTHDERGGSSSPVEVADRLEDLGVARRALRDLDLFPRLLEGYEQECVIVRYSGPNESFAKAAEQLAALVRRYTVPVDHDADLGAPGCKSCARTATVNGKSVGGHYAEVWAKRPAPGLCYPCYLDRGRFGQIPPVMYVHLRHSESRATADRWLRKEDPRLYRKAMEAAKKETTKV